MNSLEIEGGGGKPTVILDKKRGEFSFKGDSHVFYDFFDPIFQWINEYILNPNDVTVVVFKLSPLSTGIMQFYIKILRKFEEIYEQNKRIEIQWFYPDDELDMEEDLNEISQEFRMPFKLKPIKWNKEP